MTEFSASEASAENSTVRLSDGRRLAVTTGGSGTSAVVFESGSPGNAGMWSKVAPLTRAIAQTVTYTRSGYAPSDPITWPRSLASAASDLREVIAATTAGPVIAVAHSMGGLIVRTAVSRWPELFRALVLVDTTPVSYLRVAADHLDERRPGEDEFDVALAAQESIALDQPGCLRDMPVLALFAGEVHLPPEVPPWRRSFVADPTHRSSVAALSTHTSMNIVEGCGHDIPLHEPRVVADTVHALVAR